MDKHSIPDLSKMPATAVLMTASAAAALGRAPQTLRKWASHDCGPIRPLRVGGRLAWKVADVRRVLELGEDA